MARKVKEMLIDEINSSSLDGISATQKIVETNAVNSPVKDIGWEANQMSTQSKTHLEDDKGIGGAFIIRTFTFAANAEAFAQHSPTKQELFNYHHKFIETMLWKDGMRPVPEVEPKIVINKKKTKYRIFVGAMPQKGHILREQPQTLSEITNTKAQA